eukprot:14496605-Heterocapsa_arctica.AAC.1
MQQSEEEAPRGKIRYCVHTGEPLTSLRCPVSKLGAAGKRPVHNSEEFQRVGGWVKERASIHRLTMAQDLSQNGQRRETTRISGNV